MDVNSVVIRPARWPDDAEALSAMDTSFITDRVYRPVLSGLSSALVEAAAHPPLAKRYPLDLTRPEGWTSAAVAVHDRVVGFVATVFEEWNRRLVVEHLYVDPQSRGRGIGRKLLDEADATARRVGARCLWLETQNVNGPAIHFYLRCGFRWCGFDAGLYDPRAVDPSELALFFIRPTGEDL